MGVSMGVGRFRVYGRPSRAPDATASFLGALLAAPFLALAVVVYVIAAVLWLIVWTVKAVGIALWWVVKVILVPLWAPVWAIVRHRRKAKVREAFSMPPTGPRS